MSSTEAAADSLETIVSLAKRRGFIFQSSEIYGGLGSCYDYGPLGVELKRNVKAAWWKDMVQLRDNITGIDASIIMHPKVWEASGHINCFHDEMVECLNCKTRARVDKLDEITNNCSRKKGKKCEWGDARQFNLMFKTNLGPVQDSSSTVYLRPETAQGIFVNFKNVLDSSRMRLPFGIAQQGKSFRNEITTRRFTFRMAEFEQMEMEYFVQPGEDEKWFEYWRTERLEWFKKLGVSEERLRLRDHEEDELAHYSKACTDIEYLFPFGWSEIEGIASRTDYDLKQHSEHSKKSLHYQDPVTNEKTIPFVIEPALGTDRAILTFLADAYREEKIDDNTRVLLKLHPRLAPYKIAVFPLLRKEGHPEKAREIHDMLKERYNSFYDESGNIGKRYRRQDEIGTPYCLTVDHQTFEDETVTLRDRDSLEQNRVKISELFPVISSKLGF